MDKIWDKAILDSEIIQDIEHAKCNNPELDINFGYSTYNWSLLMYAANMNRIELVEYLLMNPRINVNHRSLIGDTVLHICNQSSILKLFLNHKDLDVNIQNNIKETGLHSVCHWEHKTCIKEYLLDARINTSICDRWGRMALDIALRKGYTRIAKIVGNSGYTTLLRIPNNLLLHDIVRMIIEEYT